MKKIIHVDMDCFYAQVEMRDNPKLLHVPLAIGGAPKTRSVLCTSNYIARKFGVRSAMPTDLAIKKCPNLVVLPPNFAKYQEASEIIQSVFYKYTDIVEPLSLDEAYLDVSHESHASLLLSEIKKQILKETQLTSSVGLAPNKFLAKVASDWKKPDGLFIIRPNEVQNFVKDLDVKLIPGVGQKGLQVLHSLNIKKCSDIQKIDQHKLISYFGKFGHSLFDYSRGIDDRDVINEWERKTLSVESTFQEDYFWGDKLENYFEEVFQELKSRLLDYQDENPEKKIKKIFAKARFKDFTRTSTETTIGLCSDFSLENYKDALKELLIVNLNKKDMPVRLIGLGVRFHQLLEDEVDSIQLPLFG